MSQPCSTTASLQEDNFLRCVCFSSLVCLLWGWGFREVGLWGKVAANTGEIPEEREWAAMGVWKLYHILSALWFLWQHNLETNGVRSRNSSCSVYTPMIKQVSCIAWQCYLITFQLFWGSHFSSVNEINAHHFPCMHYFNHISTQHRAACSNQRG